MRTFAFSALLLTGCPAPDTVKTGDSGGSTDTFDSTDTGASTDTSDTSDTSDSTDTADSTALDADADGYAADVDCNDADAAVNPGAAESCDSIDNNCDDAIDEGVTTTFYPDDDADGYGAVGSELDACEAPVGYVENGKDCDDADAAINPGAIEEDCADPTDYNCDGTTGYADADSDGWAACEDCDDAFPSVHPGAAESCNGLDDNCDGAVDEGVTTTYYRDADEDSYGDVLGTAEDCSPPKGYVTSADDCDDSVAGTHPGAAELCDDTDNNCDGSVDEGVTTTFYVDGDGDLYGEDGDTLEACALPAGYAEVGGDCADADGAYNPGADESDCADANDYNCDGSVVYADADIDGFAACADCDDTNGAVNADAIEVCNGGDDDCDGDVDEGVETTFYQDLDADGYGEDGATAYACLAPSGYTTADGDCDDDDSLYNPGVTESDCTDPNDYNCDGSVVYANVDGDGFAECEDCDDADGDVNADGIESCNEKDDNCDGDVDEGVQTTYYLDGDEDGYGVATTTVAACAAPLGYAAFAGDCDDGDSDYNPGVSENDCADANDYNCDGSTLYEDVDADGFAACEDCDDSDDAVNTDGSESCNGLDDNCDGDIDEGVLSTFYIDSDADGYGEASATSEACAAPSGYAATDDDCRDDNADIFPEADGSCADGTSCIDVLDNDATAATATYTIDADGSRSGSAAFSTNCNMTIDGGGWTQALTSYLSTLSTSDSREYLYSYGSAWYRSPSTTLVWAWGSYQALNGTYYYSTSSTSSMGSFACTSSEAGSYGVGCSNGGGGTYKVLPIYNSNPSIATVMICQDRPDAFGVGACRSNVNVWVRP